MITKPIVLDVDIEFTGSAVYLYDSKQRKCFKTNNWMAIKPEWVLVKPRDVPWVGTPYYNWWDIKK